MSNSSSYVVKIIEEMEIPINNLISVVYEVNLFKNWIPFSYESKLVNFYFRSNIFKFIKKFHVLQ
jgi:hypothetical protein